MGRESERCERRDTRERRETASAGPSPAQFAELRLLYTRPGEAVSRGAELFGEAAYFPITSAASPLFLDRLVVSTSGRNAASRPIIGRNAHIAYTDSMPTRSANSPSTAAPSPPIPNAKPKNTPEIKPNASRHQLLRVDDDRGERRGQNQTNHHVNTGVQKRLACGNSSVNGRTPRIEPQITYLRPKRSPIGPPRMVPAATAPRNTNRSNWAVRTET